MRVLFDTNVVLDALLDREPWAALALFDRVESGVLAGLLGATTVATIHYIARRNVGKDKARERSETFSRSSRSLP